MADGRGAGVERGAQRLLGLLVAAWAGVQLAHLPHGRLRHWDEVYHFKVATSLLADPLIPRLRVDPLRALSPLEWWNCEVWLHKPPLPFWTAAAAMKVFSVGTFSFRLPSVALGALCLVLTFRLGREVAGTAVGIGAAVLFATSAFASDVVQGVQFGDITDIHLAAWNATAILCLIGGMRSGRAGPWAASGAAAGLAILSKLYLGLPSLALGAAAWTLSRRGRVDGPPIPIRRVLLQWAVAALVAGPPLLYLRTVSPVQFDHELLYYLHHFDAAYDPGWVHGPDWTWNEMLQRELRPPLALLGATALVAFAWVHRNSPRPAAVMTALWLAGTMAVLTVSRMKAPGLLFGGCAGLFVAIAWFVQRILARPSLLRAGVALGFAAQAATWPWNIGGGWAAAAAARLGRVVPDVAAHPESVRGMIFVDVALLLAAILGLLLQWRRRTLSPALLRAPAAVLAVVVTTASLAFSSAALREIRQHWWRSWSRGAADAIVRHGSPRVAIFVDGQAPDDRLDLELEAFTGQPALAVVGAPTDADIHSALERGRRPLLVSVRALPFFRLPQDAAAKRLEVYDLSRPLAGDSDPAASFGVGRSAVRGGDVILLGAATEGARTRAGQPLWIASCWQVVADDWPTAVLVSGGRGTAWSASQPVAYGLLAGGLRAGDRFCQRDFVDVPQDAARGEVEVGLALGRRPSLPAGLTLRIE